MLNKLKERGVLIIYGCIWGILELTLGGFLHLIHYPMKGQVMSTIGYAVLTTYMIRYKNPGHALPIGFIAAGFKFFSIFIFDVPLLSRAILNPAASIIIEAITATAVSLAVMKVIKTNSLKDFVGRLRQ